MCCELYMNGRLLKIQLVQRCVIPWTFFYWICTILWAFENQWWLISRCIFFAFCAPELLTWLRSLRIWLMRKTSWAPIRYFSIVFVFETLHTIGLALLFFIVLPELDTLRAIMLCNGVLLFPSLIIPIKSLKSSSSKAKYIFVGLDILSLIFQICGLIIWPVLNMSWEDDFVDHPESSYWILENSWALSVGLFLVSFGYWESFVEEDTKLAFLWRVKINMIEEGTRFTSYLIISLWKMGVFLGLFCLLLPSLVSYYTLF